MSLIAVSAYKPLPGFDTGFKEILKEHTLALREEGYITDQKVFQMQAVDGTILEVYEWISEQAKVNAHHNPRIVELWSRFYEYSEMVKLMDLMECHEPFATFRGLHFEDIVPTDRAIIEDL